MGPCRPRVRWDIDYERQPTRKAASWVGVSSSFGAVNFWVMSVNVPRLLELQMYRRIYSPEMGDCRPRVQRNLAVVPPGNFRRALAP